MGGARLISETSSTRIKHQTERVRTLGHDTVNVDRVDAGLLEVLAELNEALVAVALAHLRYPTSDQPSEQTPQEQARHSQR